MKWTPACEAKNKAWLAKRAAERVAKPRTATIGHLAPDPAGKAYTEEESSLAHAAVMASRSGHQQYGAYPPAAGIFQSHQQRAPHPWGQERAHRVSTDNQGWTHPWSEPEPTNRQGWTHQWPEDESYSIHVMVETGAETRGASQRRANSVMVTMTDRKAASLRPALTPTRISIGLQRVQLTGATRPPSGLLYQDMLHELQIVVAAMPKTMGAMGRWAWPSTAELRDRVMWNRGQEELRQHRLALEAQAADEHARQRRRTESATDDSDPLPLIAHTHAVEHPNALRSRWTSTGGVSGVTYPRIPSRSNHREAGHPLSSDSTEAAWMFDSGAGIPGFRDPYGLSPTFALERPVTVGGIVSSTNLTVTRGAMLDNLRVLHDPRFSANCLPSSAIVDAGWKVAYHAASDSFQVITASQHRLGFHRYVMENGAITKHYLCHPAMAYLSPPNPVTRPQAGDQSVTVAATTVQGNLSMVTPQDGKAAALAHKYLTNMGGSMAHGILRLPLLRGVNSRT